MPVQMLFYEQAAAVSRSRHHDFSVEVRDYGFCRNAVAVPLTAVEFPSAAAELPIVFVESGEAVQPAAVLGLRKGQNLLVGEDGSWQGRYIPAFVRRYPFAFASKEGDGRLVLCVDEACKGLNRAGRGQALFGAQREPSAYTAGMLRFLQEYRAQSQRTRAFTQRVRELGLLEPVQARFTWGATPLALGGFARVQRERLDALPGAQLEELARTGGLELLYLHLQSLRNFEALRARLPQPPREATAIATAAAPREGITLH
jgi:hypothetical protein